MRTSGGRVTIGRGRGTLRNWACLLFVAGALTACEQAIDPVTGQSQNRWTLPFTAANAERGETQWRQCVKFRSESYCRRNLPGGRPLGISESQPIDNGELVERPDDP